MRRFSKCQRHWRALATENLRKNWLWGPDDKVDNKCNDNVSTLLDGAVADKKQDCWAGSGNQKQSTTKQR